MTEFLKLIFLAVLQGITEFLPVSSSGHLAICDNLLGLNYSGVRVEVMLHFGTLIAVVLFYWKTLLELICGFFSGKREAIATVSLVLLGCIPVGIAGVALQDWIEARFDGSSLFTGAMLMITGTVLFSLKFAGAKTDAKLTWWRALLIGIAQAVALLPGISRSGSTIAAARFLGIEGRKAADYSFLMSIPLLFGATFLEVVKSAKLPEAGEAAAAQGPGWGMLIPTVAVSCIVGYFSIKFLMKVISGTRFWVFGLYCLAAGAILLTASLLS